jgi:hypothetical protein
MSLLDSQIEVFRLCVRINRLRYQIVRDYRMTPNVKGLGAALAKLKHDLDLQASGALSELSSLGDRANAAMGKAKAKIAETTAAVEEIEAFVADEGSNGGPTLSDSSDTSAAQSLAAPEHLTVNGVST